MTSLRQQLKNLAVPQTSNLADSKKRVSILFDSNEAASKDRKSIYELGCKGLAELIVLNPAFAQYEDTLFHQSMLNLERSVEELSFNKELDRNIKKFCCHLSPYFMLRSAHMCIEWLIRRFKVHEYNNETFLCLILPYHETNIFVKCIQILKVKNPADRWNWLYYIQKFGKTLPKSVIINRATTEPSFLTFVCKNVVYAAKELGTEMFAQQCQINFYCSVIIGVIYNCSDVKEWQLIAILPSLLKGLKSRDEDFVSASFMIISQLVGKTRFTKKLLTAIVGQICKIDFASLQSSVILLLNLIAKTQCEVFTYFPQEAVIEFISKKWLTTIINNLTMDGTDMHFVLIPLTRTVLNLIQQNSSDSKVCKMFFETMLYEIRLSINSIKDIIGSVLEALALKWDEPKYKEEVIDLESDSEMFVEKNVIGWYSNILQILERKYPFEFNTVIKNAMENSKDDDSRSVLQKVIRLRYTSFDDDLLSIFQNMYHANPRIRSTAVQDIVKHVNESKDDFLQHGLFKDALADRFKDDNPKVIEEVLKLSTALFIEILGCKSFAENVINILHRANIHPDTWGHLQAAALTHLTTKNVVKEYDNNLILLSVMRYLLPASNDNVCLQYIKIILQSPFAEGMTFLQKIIKRFHNQQIVPINFKKEFLDIISQSNETPRPEDLVESIQNCCITSSFQLTNLLILVTACFKTNNNPKTSQIIFNFIISECSRLRLTQFSGNLWISSTKSNDIFVQLFKNFLRSLVRGTKFTNLHDWESPNQSLELFLGIFNLLSSNAFSVQHSKIDKHEWGKYLKDILSLLFLTAREKIDFLSHFLIYDNMSNIEHFTELRIRSLQLITLILRGEDKNLDLNLTFVFKVFIALSSQISSIRTCAVNILMELQVLPVKQNLETLTKAVLERRIEIIYDAEQISLILYTISNIKKKNIKTYNAFTDGIQNIIADETENIIFKSKMLQLLKHNKDINILNFVIPVALKALETIKNSGNILVLDNSAASIFNSVIMRFDEKCIQKLLTTDKNAWELIKKSLKMAKVFTYHSTEELIPVPCITLQIFDEATFNQLPTAYKVDFLKLVIETISISNNDVLFLAINKSLKQCWIDCRHVLPLLECMSNPHYSTSTISTQSGLAKITHNDINVLTSKEWQNGVILLEVLENKKRLLNSHALIPVLFNILKKCLEMDNQLPLEYTKQLILSALLQSCQKSNVENLLCELPENTFKIDLIIQCIRITQNPQTHYNALLLLSHCASIFPQQVLHNLVDIFTFMGSSITRYDDVFSFQIISNIIDSVIPILIKDEHKTRALTNPINSVLKIFSDILLDVPEHRRLPLYLKLLKTLGAEKYLWLFLCTVFESHVINNENIKPMERKGIDRITVSLPSEKLPKRIEMALKLLNQFDIDISLSTCVSLMEYVKSLPIDKEGPSSKTSKSTFKAHDFEIFDIETKSAKQLRHYKYLILQFISMFTSSVDFSKAVNIEEKNKDTQRKAIYQNFIIKTLSFIPEVTIEIEKNKNTCQCKFWKVILHHCYDILDNIISLLSPDMFLVVVYGLMQHQLITIRKKVLELLINKLQQKPADFEKCNEKNILNLLRLLQELINTVLIKTKQDDIIVSSLKTADINEKNLVQQAGFIAIKQLSKLFALKFIDNFKNIVVVLTSILKQRNRTPKIILIAVFLTLVEVMSNLKAYSVSHLPQFMPPFIDALKDQGTILQKQAPDNMSLALITSVQKLFESMPLFLGSYTTGIITELSTIWSRINNLYIEQEQRKTLIINKLDLIWFKISNDVPARILIPGCEKSFYILVETKNYLSIPFAMKLFGACISNSSNPELSVIQTDLTIFFLKALDFRTQIGSHGGNLTNEEINKIEQEIINAFVVWTLKLSESCFRPLYKKIHDWATRNNGPKQRVLTYFILNKYLSNSLKSLFVLFASEFVEIAAELLNACNTSKKNILFFADYEIFNTELIKNILYIFINVFKYDGSGFINTHKFDLLMQPIVDQLENNLVLNNEELQNILMSCIGEFAVAISSDVLWKQLNYHILLKTRVNIPKARIIAFNCCLELAKKLVDDFTSLLPDTIPFVAELFEDENPEVVKNSRAAVRELETVLGESLQKYL